MGLEPRILLPTLKLLPGGHLMQRLRVAACGLEFGKIPASVSVGPPERSGKVTACLDVLDG